MDGPHLIYFADPMCSWCYGFSPVIADIRRAFGRALPIRLVMGGLRPGTETPMTDAAKAEVRTHWAHVREASGLPFDGAVLDRPGFIYDTDPAARAVVRVRREDPDLALAYLGRVQRAFYAEGRDVANVVLFLASEMGDWVVGETIAADGGTLRAGGWYRTPAKWTNSPLLVQWSEDDPAANAARPRQVQ